MNRCIGYLKSHRHTVRSGLFLLLVAVLSVLTLWNSQKSVEAEEQTKEEAEVTAHMRQVLAEPSVLVSEDIVAVVNYGFDQTARYGRTLCLKVNVYNKSQTMSGYVSAVMINQGQDNVEYESKAVFAGGEKTEVTLSLPMNQATESLCIKIQSTKKTVVEATIPLNVYNFGNYCLVGILDQSSTELSYFENFGNKTVSLDESNFPCDISGLDILDVIVVNDFDLDQLSQKQIETLIAWVKGGGNLVMGIDHDALPNIELMNQYGMVQLKNSIDYEEQSTIQVALQLFGTSEFNSVLSKIKEYETMRSRIWQSVESAVNEDPANVINVYMGSPMLGTKTINDVNNPSIRKRVTQFQLVTQDYSNDLRNDELRLYDKVSLGKGMIQIYHFNLRNPKLTQAALSLYGGVQGELLSGFYSGIVSKVLVNLSTSSKDRISDETGGGGSTYRISDMDVSLKSIQIPTVTRYAILLMIYIILIGPVLWIVLKKAKKQQMIWLAIPLLSLIFIGLMDLAGIKTRITSPYASYMDFQLYDPANHTIEGNVYTNISIPARDSHSIALPGALAVNLIKPGYPDYYSVYPDYTAIQKEFYDYTFSNQVIHYSDAGACLEISNNPAFSSDTYQISYQKENREDLTSDLLMTASEISGSITNTLSIGFEDAVIYCNGVYISLGEFNPGDTVSLSNAISAYAGNTDSLYYGVNAVSRQKGTDCEEGIIANSSFINTMGMIYDTYLKNQEQTYFIGIKKTIDSDSPIYELSQAKASSGTSAVIIPLSVKFQQDQSYSTFVPSIDRYLVADDTLLWDQEYRIAYMNSLELSYHFPQDEKITAIILSSLFSESSEDETYNSSMLRLYFYNYNTEKYDLLFDLDSDYAMRSVREAELAPYINTNHEMKIKFETRSTDDTALNIPVISCMKEESDAQN